MLSRILYSALIVVPFLVYLATSAGICSDKELQWCIDKHKVLTDNQDFVEQTEEELNKTCSELQGAMRCLDSYVLRCSHRSQSDLYRAITSGAMKLLEDLCTPDSEFRKEYVEHASCFQNLTVQYHMCRSDYLDLLNSAGLHNLDAQDRVRITCCSFDGYKACTRQAVLEKCSEEAADFTVQIITRAAGPIVKFHCRDYKHDSIDCLNTGSSILPPTSYIFSSFTSLTVSAATYFYLKYL